MEGPGCLRCWLPILLSLQLSRASPCPPACRCDRTFVYCNERGLTAAPAGLGEGYRTLYLHNNRIANAGFPAHLHHVVSVETVFLYGNRLDEFPVNLPLNVRVLHLQENNVQTVACAPLAQLERLEELHLDDNSISTAGVEDGAFRQAARLRLLFLTKNHLSSVPLGLPPGLQELRLDENRIAVVAEEAFLNVSCLQRLLLDGNLLMDEGMAPGALLPLGALRELGLARNALTQPPALPPGGALRSLALQDNQISRLAAHAFAGLRRLERLDLSGNRLQALAPGVFAGLPGLRQLTVRGNAWHCDCGLRWVAAWLRALPAALNARGFVCQQPDELRGAAVRELGNELGHCPSPVPTLPTPSPSPSPTAPGPTEGGEGEEGPLQLSLSVLNSSALQLSWAWPRAPPVAAYRVTWARLGPSLVGRALRERLVGGGQRGLRLAQLEPRSTYRVCVIPLDASNSYRPRRDTACTEAALGPAPSAPGSPGPAGGPEQARQRDPSSPLVLVGLVGGGAGALVLLALGALVCWHLGGGGGGGEGEARGGGAGPWAYSRSRRKEEYCEAGTKKDTSILEMTESSFHLAALNNQLPVCSPSSFRDCPLGSTTVYCKNNVLDAHLGHT